MRVWRYDPADPQGLPGNNVQDLMVGADNRIWLAVEGGGISVLDAQRRAFSHYRKATHPQLASDDAWAFARQGDTVWFGTYEGGLYALHADGRIAGFRVADGLPSDTVLELAVDAAGALWIGTDAGLALLESERPAVLRALAERPALPWLWLVPACSLAVVRTSTRRPVKSAAP